jgi:hypothetical protein
MKVQNYTAAILATILLVNLATIGQVRDLGIAAFLDQLPANGSQTWIDPASSSFIRIDAYGRLNALFGLGLPTTVSGRVTARDLRDGTEQITVLLHSRNALCWGANAGTAPSTPMFGYAPQGVVSGAGPAATGDVTTRLVYAPQPNGEFNINGEIENWFGTIRCDGTLRAGSGYAEGTPGFAQSTQVGLLSTGVPDGCPPEKDANCFPSEVVRFGQLGN